MIKETSREKRPLKGGAWALLPALLTIFLLVLIRRSAVSVPFADEFHFTTLFTFAVNGKIPPITELLATHNGHPYLILKSIITAILLLGLPWKVLMYAQPLFLTWCFFIVARAGQLNPIKSWLDALVYIALAACIITPRIWEDLYWGMQLSAEMCLAFSLLSFHLVGKYAIEASSRTLTLALLSALAASMSAGAGIVVPPMVVAAIFLVPGKRNYKHLCASGAFLIASSVLTLLCFKLSTDPGIGHGPLKSRLVIEHAARMLAHLYYDFQNGSPVAPWFGLFTGLVGGYVALRLSARWPQHLFAVLCALLGLGLIAMITYARVKAGLFQPNASRYVPAVLPLSIALLLMLRSLDMRLLTAFFCAVACAGFVQSAKSEWHISPYHKASFNAQKAELCVHYKTSNIFNTATEIRVMHKLFCEQK